jgi:hypothetical protein
MWKQGPNGLVVPWWYGFPVHVEDTNVQVQTSPTKILELNPAAVSFMVTNNGSNPVTIHYNATVSVNKGILIPNGWAPYTYSGADMGPLAANEWWGIAASAAAYVTIHRLILD